LTCCSLSLAACDKTRHLASIPIPPERIDCVKTSKRPALPPEYSIDWASVGAAPTVPEALSRAKAEVAKFVATIRQREGRVAGYILEVEGELFACSNDAAWLREWQAKVTR
jgi:hypothetical protein